MIAYILIFFILIFLFKIKSEISKLLLLILLAPNKSLFQNIDLFFYFNLNNLFFYIILPFIIIYKLSKKNIVKKELYNYLTNFRDYIYILSVFFITYIMSLYITNINHIKYPLFIVMFFYKGLIWAIIVFIFSKNENLNIILSDFYKIILITLLYSVFIGFLQKNINIQFFGLSTLYMPTIFSTVDEFIQFGRVSSIFTWTNQYAGFIALSLAILILLEKKRIIYDIFIITICLLGYMQTASRTGIILFVLALILSLYFKYKSKYLFILMPFLAIVIYYWDKILLVLDPRTIEFIRNLRGKEFFYYELFPHRYDFWIYNLKLLFSNIYNVFTGSWKLINESEYIVESGYIYVMITGGIVALFMYIKIIFRYLICGYKINKQKNIQNSFNLGNLMIVVFFLVIIAEVSMGFFINEKINETLVSLYAISIIYNDPANILAGKTIKGYQS